MKGYIIAIAVGLILGVIRLCLKVKLFHGEAYNKTFACPHCSARFKAKWYQLIFKTESVYTYNAARLKCPVCHKKDMCSVAYDDR